MPANTSKIGIIGLAAMGANLARNFSNKKIPVSIFNRTNEKTAEFIKSFGNEFLYPANSLPDFVSALEKPRKILLLVKSGAAVDEVIAELTPLLEKDDIVIDMGNSHYRDTESRRSKNIDLFHFTGCGISGGEEGALNGPSLMFGGTEYEWEIMKPFLETIAAKDFSGNPCVSLLGPESCGHYVKMVHNGIEYAIMQSIAEAYQILTLLFSMPASQIGQVFDSFNRSKLKSYLFETASAVLAKPDDKGSGNLVDKVLDKAEQKGTGIWTVMDAMEKGVPVPTIAEAVMSRIISGDKEKRVKIASSFGTGFKRENVNLDEFIHFLDDALFTVMICSFAQGIELLEKAGEEYKWDISIPEILRIWQGGCIIRASILKTLEKCYREHAASPNTHLFELPETISNLKGNTGNLRKVVETAVRNKVPVPALASAIAYFDGMTEEKSGANIIQALRDAFGAHNYERIDVPGKFSSNWYSRQS